MEENVWLIISDGYRDRLIMQDYYLSALEWISSIELEGVVSSFSLRVRVTVQYQVQVISGYLVFIYYSVVLGLIYANISNAMNLDLDGLTFFDFTDS